MNTRLLTFLTCFAYSSIVHAAEIPMLRTVNGKPNIEQFQYNDTTTFDDVLKKYHPMTHAQYMINAVIKYDKLYIFESWYTWDGMPGTFKQFITYLAKRGEFRIVLRIVPYKKICGCYMPCPDCSDRYHVSCWQLQCETCSCKPASINFLEDEETPVCKPTSPTALRDEDKKPAIDQIKDHAKTK